MGEEWQDPKDEERFSYGGNEAEQTKQQTP